MSPASWPRDEPLAERLLVLDPLHGTWQDARVGDLPQFLGRGDLLVVNDAATIPASLSGRTEAGARVELRLLARRERDEAWTAVLFGEGDWRTRTEHRAAPPRLDAAARITFAEGFSARVTSVSPSSSRLVAIVFDRQGAPLWRALYAYGRPVQYAHVRAPLELWHAQTHYASRPWAVELPSAGRPLTHELLRAIERRGLAIATLTHAAGLSSTGDAALDAMLPLPERYDIPAATLDAVADAKRRRGRVVAVGTTVVRALEGCAANHAGALVAGEGVTDLRIGTAHRLAIVDALLTGMHEPTASHFDLMSSFAPRDLLERAHAHAVESGYLGHELGDSCLIAAPRGYHAIEVADDGR